jgi:hypothetical protein
MLGAGAQAAQQQGKQQHGQAARLPRDQVGDAGQRRAAHQQAFAPPAFRHPAGQQLETGHHARVRAPQQAHHGIADGKLRLPDGQQHIDHVRQAVVHGMRTAGGEQRAAAYRFVGRRYFGGQRGKRWFVHDSASGENARQPAYTNWQLRILKRSKNNVIARLV